MNVKSSTLAKLVAAVLTPSCDQYFPVRNWYEAEVAINTSSVIAASIDSS